MRGEAQTTYQSRTRQPAQRKASKHSVSKHVPPKTKAQRGKLWQASPEVRRDGMERNWRGRGGDGDSGRGEDAAVGAYRARGLQLVERAGHCVLLGRIAAAGDEQVGGRWVWLEMSIDRREEEEERWKRTGKRRVQKGEKRQESSYWLSLRNITVRCFPPVLRFISRTLALDREGARRGGGRCGICPSRPKKAQRRPPSHLAPNAAPISPPMGFLRRRCSLLDLCILAATCVVVVSVPSFVFLFFFFFSLSSACFVLGKSDPAMPPPLRKGTVGAPSCRMFLRRIACLACLACTRMYSHDVPVYVVFHVPLRRMSRRVSRRFVMAIHSTHAV